MGKLAKPGQKAKGEVQPSEKNTEKTGGPPTLSSEPARERSGGQRFAVGAAAQILRLQTYIGNRQVNRLLDRGGPFSGNQAGSRLSGPLQVQRRVEEYRDNTGNGDMKSVASAIESNVNTAVRIIATDPLLSKVEGSDSGYLGAWVGTFREFVDNPGEVPAFFYARYGYAVETITCKLLESTNISPYTFHFQISHGHTRPDIVVRRGDDEVGWFDITSTASLGHIKKKQGSGWMTRPYVAEIAYDMPTPASLMREAGDISEEDLARLEEASRAGAEREANFEKGKQSIAVELGEAYRRAIEKKGAGLSKTDVKNVTAAVCQSKLGDINKMESLRVLSWVDEIEIPGSDGLYTGFQWANWAANGPLGNRKSAYDRIVDHGSSL